MYDPLTSTYSFACPARTEANVPLSAFRLLERLPAAAHPAVYRVLFECRCGREHLGLVSATISTGHHSVRRPTSPFGTS